MLSLDDTSLSLLALSPVCSACRHFSDGRKCAAFEIIPLEIWDGLNLHRTPYPGDNGIQFEPIDEGKDNGQHRNQGR